MNEQAKQEIQEIQNSINQLSDEMNQKISQLAEKLSIDIDQISQRITKLLEKEKLTNNDSNIDDSQTKFLNKPNHQEAIRNDYFINFSYIDKKIYASWIENLKKYNKSMADCRNKKQIPSYCKQANQILESTIQVLF